MKIGMSDIRIEHTSNASIDTREVTATCTISVSTVISNKLLLLATNLTDKHLESSAIVELLRVIKPEYLDDDALIYLDRRVGRQQPVCDICGQPATTFKRSVEEVPQETSSMFRRFKAGPDIQSYCNDCAIK